jgi:putative Mn2+ efflux pump MntP
MRILFFALGFGLDSLLAGLVVGSFLRSWRARLALVLAFGAFDAAAGLAGPLWPHRIPEPPAFVAYLLCAVLLAAGARYNRALFYLLPLVLSLDNLFCGAPANALAQGAVSALMALLGLSLAPLVSGGCLAMKAEA